MQMDWRAVKVLAAAGCLPVEAVYSVLAGVLVWNLPDAAAAGAAAGAVDAIVQHVPDEPVQQGPAGVQLAVMLVQQLAGVLVRLQLVQGQLLRVRF